VQKLGRILEATPDMVEPCTGRESSVTIASHTSALRLRREWDALVTVVGAGLNHMPESNSIAVALAATPLLCQMLLMICRCVSRHPSALPDTSDDMPLHHTMGKMAARAVAQGTRQEQQDR